MNLFTELRPKWHVYTPKALLEASPEALNAVDSRQASALQEVLDIATLRAMVAQPVVDWVWRTHGQFRAGLIDALPHDAADYVTDEWLVVPVGDWLEAPLHTLRDWSAEQVQRLEAELGWRSVRQMATDSGFAVAREVHRIVTGGPVSPEAAAPRKLTNYFAGATQKWHARQREAARLPAQPSPTSAGLTTERSMEDDSPSAVAERLRPKFLSHSIRGGRRQRRDYTPEGAYIPLGGGSRGWLDNSGVARSEQANQYRYHDAVDETHFRRGMSRAGTRSELRDADRVDMQLQVLWTTHPTAEPNRPGVCLDVSMGGARLKLGRRMPLKQYLHVIWMYRGGEGAQDWPVLDLPSTVVRCEEENEGGSEPVFDIGITFGAISEDTSRRIRLLLSGQADVLQRLRANSE